MSTWIASQDTFLQAEPEPERLVQAVSRRPARGIQFDARETGFVGVDKDILVGKSSHRLVRVRQDRITRTYRLLDNTLRLQYSADALFSPSSSWKVSGEYMERLGESDTAR
ncbi:hypothetical protein BD560DRAFT_489887 [Blakeslea trispora]|nr:hypothetical protein BD560DRAFT_489887 [Blakeslea trispora]